MVLAFDVLYQPGHGQRLNDIRIFHNFRSSSKWLLELHAIPIQCIFLIPSPCRFNFSFSCWACVCSRSVMKKLFGFNVEAHHQVYAEYFFGNRRKSNSIQPCMSAHHHHRAFFPTLFTPDHRYGSMQIKLFIQNRNIIPISEKPPKTLVDNVDNSILHTRVQH